jgi:hypothetical protein
VAQLTEHPSALKEAGAGERLLGDAQLLGDAHRHRGPRFGGESLGALAM